VFEQASHNLCISRIYY